LTKGERCRLLGYTIHGIKPANRRRVVVENAAQPPVPDRRLGDLVGQLSDAVMYRPQLLRHRVEA